MEFVYCGCGSSKAKELLFKCGDHRHGAEFERFSSRGFKVVQTLYGSSEIKNILFCGESQAGKSTMINSIFNYLAFGTLDNALMVLYFIFVHISW